MQDPNDTGTLDLVAACARPLTAAERQKRLRDKRRWERAAGLRVDLDLKATEVALVTVALGEFRERWQRVPSKAERAAALLARLPSVSIADAFPGDSAWLPDAVRQADRVEWPAHSSYQYELGFRNPCTYRQTPHGQPEVDALVKPGDKVWTSYDSGPYRVTRVIRQEWNGLRCYSLAMIAMDGRGSDAGINELVAVDGRLLKLFANNADEVFVVSAEALEAGEPLPEPVRKIEEDKAQANAWYQEGRRLEKVVNELRAEVDRLSQDNRLLEEERNKAFAAYKVLEQRLRDAGLSTDYRE